MPEKQRYTVSLPDHVTEVIEKRAKALGATPTEYAGGIIRWWFGQGCPPVTPDEAQLRKQKFADLIKGRLEPVPQNLDVWSLDRNKEYMITDDAIVRKLLDQLGLPNLFAQAAEHDEIRFSIAFENHPTHWLVLDLYNGSTQPDGDGLLFRAYSKSVFTRQKMLTKLQAEMEEMESTHPFKFSQIPPKAAPTSAAQNAATARK